jgi:Hydrolytic ATP binding site of dynein motor region
VVVRQEFGKALARFVVVYNCSESLNHHALANIFSGIAQSGTWVCLDEINRINTEALSVMATQMSIFLQVGTHTFLFVPFRFALDCCAKNSGALFRV